MISGNPHLILFYPTELVYRFMANNDASLPRGSINSHGLLFDSNRSSFRFTSDEEGPLSASEEEQEVRGEQQPLLPHQQQQQQYRPHIRVTAEELTQVGFSRVLFRKIK